MRYLIISIALICGFSATAQITFTAPVAYVTGAPAGAPSASGSRLRVDLLTNKVYQWQPTALTWNLLPYGITEISGCSAPAYTPTAFDGPFAINKCTPNPELYYYFSGSWYQVGGTGGGSGTVTSYAFTDGNGFDGTVTNATTTPTLSLATTVSGIIYGNAGALQPVTVGGGLTFSTGTLAAVDQSATNEIQSLSYSTPTVSLSNGGGSVNLSDLNETVSAGTGISVNQVGQDFAVTNTAPDQTVTITGATGAYPTFALPLVAVAESYGIDISGTTTRTISVDTAQIATLYDVSQAQQTVSAGTGISVSQVGQNYTVTNTGDLSATNELNTAFTVTGGNLRLTDAGGNLDVPVANIAPVQAVGEGYGIDITGTTTRTVSVDTAQVATPYDLTQLTLDGEVIGPLQNNVLDTVQRVMFSRVPTAAGGVGILRWNETDGTLDLGYKGGNVTLQIGQETTVRVVNKSGSTLTDGEIVYVSGAQGNRIAVRRALADSDSMSNTVLGIVTETILNNQEGYITTEGLVRGLNTSAFAEGAPLYLSATTPGAITTTPPSGPDHNVLVGYCVRQHATVGIIYAKVKDSGALISLSDVSISAPLTGQALVYNGTTWQNQSSGGDVSGAYDNLQLGTGVVGPTELAATTVTAGTYGSATQVPQVTVDTDGRLTSVSNVTITGDNWGTDVVNHDGTLTGNGTAGTPLKVDTSVISTLYDVSVAATPQTLSFTSPNLSISGGNSADLSTLYSFSTGLTNTSNAITANLSTGISGGQSAIGGTASGENLTLQSTSNATKGKIFFGANSAYNQANDRFGINQTTPTATLHLLQQSIASVGSGSGTAATTLFTITGTTGGATSANSGTVFGGNGGGGTISGGAGGSTTGTPGTGFGGNGGSLVFTGGNAGSGQNFGGTGGFVEMAGGTGGFGATAGPPGYASIKGGNAATSSNGQGGNVYVVPGIGDGIGAHGAIYLGLSPSLTQRGNVKIGGSSPPAELLTLGETGTKLGNMSFAGNTSGKVVVQPAAAAGSWTLTLPTDDGTPGQVLTTDGSGVASWTDDDGLTAVITDATLTGDGTGGNPLKVDTSVISTINDLNSFIPNLTEFQIAFGDNANKMTSDTALIWESDSLRLGINWTNPTAELTLKGSQNPVPAGDVAVFDGNVYCGCYTLGDWIEDFDEGAFVSTTSPTDPLIFNVGVPSSGTYDLGGFMFFIGSGSVDIEIGANTYTVNTTGVFTFAGIDFTGVTEISVTYTGSGSAYIYAFQVGYTLLEDIVSRPIFQVIDRDSGLPYGQFGLVVNYSNVSLSNTMQMTTGERNIAFGAGALKSLTTGDQNIALGDSALIALTVNSQNLAIGANALKNATGGTNTSIGFGAGTNVTGSGNLIFGANAATSLSGSNNTFIGTGSGGLSTAASNNVGIGINNMFRRTGGTGNIALGANALSGPIGGNNTGSQNIAIGLSAGLALTEASNNILIGDNTGRALTTGFTNTIIGGGAGWNITTGYTNVFHGQQAGYSVTSGYDNTYIGRESGWTCTDCHSNIYIGNGSGRNNSTSTNNNVGIGANAGYSNAGSLNVFLGPNAGYNNTLSNSLWIENSSSTTPLIGADFSANRVGINTSLTSASNITSTLHVTGTNGYNQLRLATSYTPTSTSDTNGNIGDVAWDDSYWYVKTSAGWKRTALSTF